jgi:hypothetical protein
MNNDMGIGIVIGLMVWPLLTFIDIAGKIVVNAIKETNGCNQDCKQGRDCNCKK